MTIEKVCNYNLLIVSLVQEKKKEWVQLNNFTLLSIFDSEVTLFFIFLSN